MQQRYLIQPSQCQWQQIQIYELTVSTESSIFINHSITRELPCITRRARTRLLLPIDKIVLPHLFSIVCLQYSRSHLPPACFRVRVFRQRKRYLFPKSFPPALIASSRWHYFRATRVHPSRQLEQALSFYNQSSKLKRKK